MIEQQHEMTSHRSVVIDYTNWKGNRATRKVIPDEVYFGESEYHDGRQWLLKAFDLNKREWRTFTMKDIHSWRPAA